MTTTYPFEQWEQDPQFQRLPIEQKQKAYLGYFERNVADDDFRGLPVEKQSNIKQEFLRQEMKPVSQKEQAPEAMPSLGAMPIGSHGQKIGALETLASLATGIPAQLAGGLAFLGSLPRQSERKMTPQETMQTVQQGLTYEPRTEAGKKMTEAIGAPFKWLEEKAAPAVGEKVADVTGSPELGALAHTGTAGFPWLLPFAPKAIKGLSQSIRNSEAFRRATIKERAMVIQDLKDLLDNPQNIKEGLTEADIVRRYGGKYFEQALERRRTGETKSIFEDIIEQPVPQENAVPIPETAPYHPDFEFGTGEIRHPYPGLGPRVISGDKGEQLKAPAPEYPQTPMPMEKPEPIVEPPKYPKKGKVSALEFIQKAKEGKEAQAPVTEQADRFRAVNGAAQKPPIMPISMPEPLPISVSPEAVPEVPMEQAQLPTTPAKDETRIEDQAMVQGEVPQQPEEVTPPAEQPAPAEAKAKEPWEMTKDELIHYPDKWKMTQKDYVDQIRRKSILREKTTNPPLAKQSHYLAVKEAISEGKPVPPEVLKDYPDLKAEPPAKKEAHVAPVEEEGVKVSRAGTRKNPNANKAKTYSSFLKAIGGVNPRDSHWKGEIKRYIPLSAQNKKGHSIDEILAITKEYPQWSQIKTEQDIFDAAQSKSKPSDLVESPEWVDKQVKAEEERLSKLTDDELNAELEGLYGSSEIKGLEGKGALAREDKKGAEEDVAEVGREYGLRPEEEDALIRKAEEEAPWLFEKEEPVKEVVSEETKNKIRSYLKGIEGVKDVEENLDFILRDEDFLKSTLAEIDKESAPKTPTPAEEKGIIKERRWFGEAYIAEQDKIRPFHEFKDITPKRLPLFGGATPEKKYQITLVDGTKVTVKEADIRSFPEAERPEGELADEGPDVQTISMFPDIGPGPSEKGFLGWIKDNIRNERGSFSWQKKGDWPSILTKIQQTPRYAEGGLVLIDDFHKQFPEMPKPEFDKMVLDLADDGKIALHQQDLPSAYKKEMVKQMGKDVGEGGKIVDKEYSYHAFNVTPEWRGGEKRVMPIGKKQERIRKE